MFLYTNLHKTVKTMNAICKQKCTQILCIAFKMAIAIFQLTSKSDFLKKQFYNIDYGWNLEAATFRSQLEKTNNTGAV